MSPWRAILEVARYAPSPHNVQPWRIRLLDETTAELWLERDRALPREDLTGSFLVLTMGLFTESVRLVAANHGFRLEERRTAALTSLDSKAVDAMREERVLFSVLTLVPGGPVSDYADDLFHRRRTSRLAYGPEPVGFEDARDLALLAARWGRRYVQSSNADRIEHLLDWNIEAVFEDLNQPGYRNELAHWLRYTDRQSLAHRDGLDARCMNQNPFELWLAFHAPALVRWPKARAYFHRRYLRQIGPVATMGVLSGGFWNPADAYDSGRFLIHFWLECTRRGLSIHPYGNLVTHRATAAKCEKHWRVSDIWLEFKIGRSKEAPASRRRALEEILLA